MRFTAWATIDAATETLEAKTFPDLDITELSSAAGSGSMQIRGAAADRAAFLMRLAATCHAEAALLSEAKS